MNKETEERIKADAEAYAERENSAYVNDYNGYIAGATAENTHMQPIIDAAEKVAKLFAHKGDHQTCAICQLARALEQWKGKEEEEEPKEQLIPTAVYKQVGSSMMEHTKEETCGHCGNEPGKHYIGNQLYLCDECMETHTEDCY